MKYQDIEIELKAFDCPPPLRKVIIALCEDNAGLKQEIMGLAQALDRTVQNLVMLTEQAGLHSAMLSGMSEGKSASDVVAELRAEHLTGLASEEVKQ